MRGPPLRWPRWTPGPSLALASLCLALAAGPALADDGDPWGVGAAPAPAPPAPAPAPPAPPPPGDPWAPPQDPADAPPPPPPPVLPLGQAPPGAGFDSKDRCRAAWQADRRGLSRVAATWAHPSTERCVYAAGADRWAIQERPAAMVLSAGVDLPLLAGAGAAGLAAAMTDPVARGRDHWDPTSESERAAAGAGAQRRDPLPDRTEPDLVARDASDVIFGAAWAGVALSPWGLPARNGRLVNLAVVGEAAALNVAVQQLVARSVAEPRPLAFQDMSAWTDQDFADVAGRLARDDTWTSYYSGHTSTVASVAYAYATAWTIDAVDAGDGRAGLALLLYPAAFMVSNLEGELRVYALAHDPTDVWVGHLAGGLIGIGVPTVHHLAALHGRSRPGAPQAAPLGPRGVVVQPLVGPGTLGLQGRW